MIILPAIDIQNGQCVRLSQGDFKTVEQVAADPLETALSFQEAGAQWLHMVDLDGARLGKRVNEGIFAEIVQKTKLKVELGGGIRDMETIEAYLALGIQRVVLGTAAIRDPQLVKEAASKYGDRIAVGIDAMNGKVKVEGWLEDSDQDYLSLAKAMEAIGIKYLIFTDISKDGTLAGPNLEQLQAIQKAVSCRIIASGGIRSLQDIVDLRNLSVYGAICGKSLYKGTLDLKEALAAAGDRPAEGSTDHA